MSDLPTYFRYWGKAEKNGGRHHLLPYHCLEVAAEGHSLLVKNLFFTAEASNQLGPHLYHAHEIIPMGAGINA